MNLKPAHLTEEQRKILRAVALAYRRVMRAPGEAAKIRADAARLAQERQTAALAAATSEYCQLTPSPSEDPRKISGEVNRMTAAAINADPSGRAWTREECRVRRSTACRDTCRIGSRSLVIAGSSTRHRLGGQVSDPLQTFGVVDSNAGPSPNRSSGKREERAENRF